MMTSCTFFHVADPGLCILFSQTLRDPSKDKVLIEACVVIPMCFLSFSGSGGGERQSLGLLIPESLGSAGGSS